MLLHCLLVIIIVEPLTSIRANICLISPTRSFATYCSCDSLRLPPLQDYEHLRPKHSDRGWNDPPTQLFHGGAQAAAMQAGDKKKKRYVRPPTDAAHNLMYGGSGQSTPYGTTPQASPMSVHNAQFQPMPGQPMGFGQGMPGQGQQMGMGGQPMGAAGQPMGMGGQPMGMGGQPMGAPGQPMGMAQGMPGQPMGMSGQPGMVPFEASSS
jgi:hypothetical protein